MKKVFLTVLMAFVFSILFLIGLPGAPSAGQNPSTYWTKCYSPDDTLFRDLRLQTVRKGRDMSYELPVYHNLAEWEQRTEYLRQHILVSTGLWPMPEKTPLNAKIYDKIEHKDYSVEKVYFESYPGFFVTGNLYRPVGKKGPFPAIISPHGHWKHGRLENSDVGSVPGRCINFARQGYVIFSYDMVGYQDSRQISHKFAKSKRHQLWGISLMGLQLWNSIRALDFITSLPDVDSKRIGCTGASGGGTQTFMVTAVDSRIKVAAPVNMISAHFQGGCLCENAPGLRLQTFNVEIGALTAPRPLLMVSTTQDWTKNTPTIEYPMMRSIYKLYRADDKLKYVQYDFPHNYNKTSREAVYAWFGRWLQNGANTDRYNEQPFTVEPPEKLLNFPGEQKPPGDMDEKKLTDYLIKLSQQRLQTYWPNSPGKIARFRQVYGMAYEHVLAADQDFEVKSKDLGRHVEDDFVASRIIISRSGKNDWIPALFLQPLEASNRATILIHPHGKSAFLDVKTQKPVTLVKKLLDQSISVLLIDPFKIGEHVLTKHMRQRDEDVAYFTTFNKTDTQERVQDILTVIRYLQNNYESISLCGLEVAGAWAALAAGLKPEVDRVLVDAADADWESETFLLGNIFMPGLARVGGLATAVALTAPAPVVIYRGGKIESKSLQQAYEAVGSSDLKVFDKDLSVNEIVNFLVK